jgi:hypothetical protein
MAVCRSPHLGPGSAVLLLRCTEAARMDSCGSAASVDATSGRDGDGRHRNRMHRASLLTDRPASWQCDAQAAAGRQTDVHRSTRRGESEVPPS